MGRSRKKKDVSPDKPIDQEPPSLTSTLKYFCGCCNKKFNKSLGKTRKFLLKLNTPASGLDCGNDEAKYEDGQQTMDIWQAVEQIFIWRYGKKLTGSMDQNLALCPTCGILVAKLYATVKLFEEAKDEMSYLTKVVEKILLTETKGTDTTEDATEEEALRIAEAETSQQEDYGDGGELATFDEDGEIKYYGQIPVSRMRDNSDKEYLCQYCSAGFNKHTNLTRHLLLSHEIGDREKDFRCEVCGKQFYFGYLLNNHAKFHAEERPYVCEIEGCSGSFKSKLGLQAHVKNYHRPNRPFKCKFCPKDFKDRRNHRIHEEFVHMISKGVKPWTCEFCGMKYRRKHSMGPHRQKCSKNPNRLINLEEENEAAVQSIGGDEMEVAAEITVDQTQSSHYIESTLIS